MDPHFIRRVAGQAVWLALGIFIIIAAHYAAFDWPLDRALGDAKYRFEIGRTR